LLPKYGEFPQKKIVTKGKHIYECFFSREILLLFDKEIGKILELFFFSENLINFSFLFWLNFAKKII
jgi:hypothetical protein